MDGAGSPVIAGLAVGIGFVLLLAAIVNISVSPAIPEQELQDRYGKAAAVAISQPEVQAAVNDAASVGVNYRWLYDRDRVTYTTVGSVTFQPLYDNFTGVFLGRPFQVEDDRIDVWLLAVQVDVRLMENAIGYSRTESGNKRVEVDVDRKTNAILAVRVDSLQDDAINFRLSEKQQRIIKLVLSDSRVKELVGKDQYFIAHIRGNVGYLDCTPKHCVLVSIGLMSEPRSGASTTVIVDVATGEVVDVNPPLQPEAKT